jgi:hypothetical protein
MRQRGRGGSNERTRGKLQDETSRPERQLLLLNSGHDGSGSGMTLLGSAQHQRLVDLLKDSVSTMTKLAGEINALAKTGSLWYTGRDLEPFRSPKLLTIEVLVDHLVRSIPGILAVEWHAHDEEARAEYRLLLGVLDLALVGAIGHTGRT